MGGNLIQYLPALVPNTKGLATHHISKYMIGIKASDVFGHHKWRINLYGSQQLILSLKILSFMIKTKK